MERHRSPKAFLRPSVFSIPIHTDSVVAQARALVAQTIETLPEVTRPKLQLTWSRSLHRRRPATADRSRRHPEVAYPVPQGPDAPEVADQAGPVTLRAADADGGAGIRPDQAGPRLPTVPAAGPGQGQRRVVADLHRPQPAQTVQIWGGSASRNTDQRVCRKCPEHRRGGQHSETSEAIGPSMAAPGNSSCRRLTLACTQGPPS